MAQVKCRRATQPAACPWQSSCRWSSRQPKLSWNHYDLVVNNLWHAHDMCNVCICEFKIITNLVHCNFASAFLPNQDSKFSSQACWSNTISPPSLPPRLVAVGLHLWLWCWRAVWDQLHLVIGHHQLARHKCLGRVPFSKVIIPAPFPFLFFLFGFPFPHLSGSIPLIWQWLQGQQDQQAALSQVFVVLFCLAIQIHHKTKYNKFLTWLHLANQWWDLLQCT